MRESWAEMTEKHRADDVQLGQELVLAQAPRFTLEMQLVDRILLAVVDDVKLRQRLCTVASGASDYGERRSADAFERGK